MKKQDLLSVLITFLFGFFVGVFLYVTGGAEVDKKTQVPVEEKLSEFTIVGDVYGGCRDACPSFQVLSDGSYRYYRTPAAGAESVLRQGSLPSLLLRKLRAAVTPVALAKQSNKIEPSVCNSFSDGIDVKYKITLDGVEYNIDSCGTTVDDNGALWTTLGEIWDHFETSGNN
ncbi:MAG: hypothetical protein RLZZ230_97 [Candidatus Parcubacteria bacterium]|jgi:hypothetical protein